MTDARKSGEAAAPGDPPQAGILAALRSPAALRGMLARQSLAMLVGTAAAGNLLRIGGNLILTRMLAPEAFGVMGVIGAVSFILTLLTDMGFNVFVIRSPKSVEPRFINVIWTLRLVRTIVLTALMFAFAGTLASLFGKPALQAPLMVCSFLFLIDGLHSMAPTLAMRARRVSFISALDLTVLAIQIAATLAAALVIRSFWAIVIGSYVSALAKLALSYLLFPGAAHRLAYDREIARELWRFSRMVIVASTITVVLSQTDKVIISRMLSLDALGLYMIAANLTTAGGLFVVTYVEKMLLPAFAEAGRESRETLVAIYYAMRRRMTLVLAFLFGGGIGGGSLLARILFDDRYLDSGVFISLLCLAPLFSLVTRPAEQALIALGRMRAMVEANIVRLVWIALAAPTAFYVLGVNGLIAAFALAEAAASPYWWWQLKKQGILNWRAEMAPFAAAALGALTGASADWLANYLIASGMAPPF